MVCSNCGTALPEGTRFCGQCGAQVIAKNKREYLQKLAPDKIRAKAKFSKILALVCVVLMLISYLVVINTSLEKIPVIATVAQGNTDDFYDVMDDMEEFYEILEEGMDEKEDELEDMLTKGQIRKLEKLVKAVKKCSTKLSISNFNTMVKRFEAVAKMEVDDEAFGDVNDELEEIQEIKLVLGLASGILFFGAAASAVFLFFGGFFHKSALAILGTIGAFFYCLMGCGLLMLLVVLAVAVLMILQCTAVSGAYKAHRTVQ